MPQKFELGASVIIQPDKNKLRQTRDFNSTLMLQYSGKKAIVVKYVPINDMYRLDIDGQRFVWDEDALLFQNERHYRWNLVLSDINQALEVAAQVEGSEAWEGVQKLQEAQRLVSAKLEEVS